jgi:hypothetical protein
MSCASPTIFTCMRLAWSFIVGIFAVAIDCLPSLTQV